MTLVTSGALTISQAAGDPVRPLRLGFVTGRQLIERDGRYYGDPGLTRVVNRLDQHYPGMVLAATIYEPTNLLTETVNIPTDRLFPLPAMTSTIDGTSETVTCRRIIKKVEDRCDIVVVQLPFQAPFALFPARKPRLYHVIADVVGVAKGSTTYTGVKRIPTVMLGTMIDTMHTRLMHRPHARVITNGEQLFSHHHAKGDWVVSATLSREEISSVTRQRPADAPKRVLFVGHLRNEKGIDVLLAAWPAVRERFPDAELHVVGFGDPNDLDAHTAERFRQAIDNEGLVHRGALPFGPELFQEYADADVMALPSRSEGTPRVLIEARGFGCPVISTPGGGTASSVTNGVDGLLVQPNDPDALQHEIIRVLSDDELRANLVTAGLARANASTVEAYVDKMAAQIDLIALELGLGYRGTSAKSSAST